MQQQDSRTGNAEALSVRYAMDPGGRGNDYTSGAQGVGFREGGGAALTTYSLAPAQSEVVREAPTANDAIARIGLQALEILRATATGRVLLLEPVAGTIALLLREGGFQGKCVALLPPAYRPAALGRMGWSAGIANPAVSEPGTLVELADVGHPPLPLEHGEQSAVAREDALPAQEATILGFDRMVVADWLTAVREQRAPELPDEQRFQVIVARDLSRLLAPQDWRPMFQWLRGLLAPEGFLITEEPGVSFQEQAFERDLLADGFLLAADAWHVESGESPRILWWQYRPNDFSRLPSALVRVTRSQLEASAVLRQAVTASFREVFGGDEWGEWMYCGVCLRQYSRRAYEELDPAGLCPCGAEDALEVFNPPAEVLAELSRDLADDERSRLYVCIGETHEVEAFIWGYLAPARQIAELVLPRQGASERQRLTESLHQHLARLGAADPENALVYHQAYIGSVKQSRSFSLPRALFARMCQFALENDAQLAVTATIPSVNAYALLRGIEMEVLYSYPPLPNEGRGHDTQEASPGMPYTRLDESGVIVGGSTQKVLSALMGKSDRALAKAVAAFLRQQRGSGNSESGSPTHGSGTRHT